MQELAAKQFCTPGSNSSWISGGWMPGEERLGGAGFQLDGVGLRDPSLQPFSKSPDSPTNSNSVCTKRQAYHIHTADPTHCC